jgi:NADH-quinone oxidoreductase subunit E
MASAQEIKTILESYPQEKRHSLAILQDVQRKFGYVPKEAFSAIAEYLRMKTAPLYAMATFYRALSLKPKGVHVIKVCDGTACHIRGAPLLLEVLERSLGIKAGGTTGDGFFSVETVNCVGACAISPVMIVDDTVYSKVTPDKVEGILASYRGKSNG